MHARFAFAIMVVTAGCSVGDAFHCSDSSQCVEGGLAGTCESDGACSFPDLSCFSGRRYGQFVPASEKDQCVTPSISILGGATGGAGSIDGAGVAARFGITGHIAWDGVGSLYATDYLLHVIRRIVINPPSYQVTTIAGTPGVVGNFDGVGAAAQLDSPEGIVVDGNGHIFVADTGNDLIRRIDLANGIGTVTTIAGGSAGALDGNGTKAQFRQPHGLALDDTGEFLFVADNGNATIRQIDLQSLPPYQVTTIAGAAGKPGSADGDALATARFNHPQSLIFENNLLFVADRGNDILRQIDLLSFPNQVSTLAGIDGVSGTTDGQATALFGNDIDQLAFNTYQNLFVSDPSNQTIRRITLQGVVSTIAGMPLVPGEADGMGIGGATFSAPSGLVATTVPSGQQIFVADGNNSTLRKLTPMSSAANAPFAVATVAGAPPACGYVDGAPPDSRFCQPFGIAIDGDDGFIADRMNAVVRHISLSTGASSLVAGTPGVVGSDDGCATCGATFFSPQDLTSDGQGNLYVADNHTIRQISLANATVTTIAGAAGVADFMDAAIGTDARFDFPSQMALVGDQLYVADFDNHCIRQIDLSSPQHPVSTLAGNPASGGSADGVGAAASFVNPTGLVADGAGNLIVADRQSNTLRKIELSTATVTTLAGLANVPGYVDGAGDDARFNVPEGITLGADGAIYVMDTYNALVRRVTADGTVSTVAGVPHQFGVQTGPLPSAQLGLCFRITAVPGGGVALTCRYEQVVLTIR